MEFYVRFEDEEEFVICVDNEKEAREMTTDFQQKQGKSEIIIEIRETDPKDR